MPDKDFTPEPADLTELFKEIANNQALDIGWTVTEGRKTIHQSWLDGDIDANTALRVLCGMLNANADRLEPLQETEKILRGQISEVVEHLGGKVDLEGFGNLQITSASITTSYDARKIDGLVTKLTESYPEIARELASYRKESARTGSLRIKRMSDS
jgi:hypothetical protein